MASSTSTPLLSLADKVYRALAADRPPGGTTPLETLGAFPRTSDSHLTRFELNCRDWGFAYGVAYAIARGEDPWEVEESVCDRALIAAKDGFARAGEDTDIFCDDAYEADRAEREAEKCSAVS